MEILIFIFVVIVALVLILLKPWVHVNVSKTEPYKPLPPFPATGFGRDEVPVSAVYRNRVNGRKRFYKRGDRFKNYFPDLYGKSFWVEVERLEDDPEPLDSSLIDEIENLLD